MIFKHINTNIYIYLVLNFNILQSLLRGNQLEKLQDQNKPFPTLIQGQDKATNSLTLIIKCKIIKQREKFYFILEVLIIYN